MNDNEQLLLNAVEAALDRGPAAGWTTYDFEKLSDAVFERSSVRLSVTTLKRLFGRLKYESAPTLSTLNALAQYVGSVDWQGFKQQGNEVPAPRRALNARKLIGGLVLLVIGISVILTLLLSASKRTRVFDPSQFTFISNKIKTSGVPNSVIFKYSTKAQTDSLFIAQSWDVSRKMKVSPEQDAHSAIYYYPGYFNAKLIANEQVVLTHDVWITSEGWLCMQDGEPAPKYLPYSADIKADGQLRLFNIQDMGALMTDNFVFETTLKNDFDDGSNACHNVQLLIECKNDMIFIPLSAPTCVGNLALYFCGWRAESKSADLSGFGCDLTQWTKVRVETVNKQATIYINGRKVYALTFTNEATGIVGVQYKFNGAAAVRDTRFSGGGRVFELK